MRKINLVIFLMVCLLSFPGLTWARSEAPVNMTFTLENNPGPGEDAILRLELVSTEDIHAEITCFFSEGIKAVNEGNFTFIKKIFPSDESTKDYTSSAGLYLGLIKKNESNVFTFKVKLPETPANYTLLAQLRPLAKYKEKEEILEI